MKTTSAVTANRLAPVPLPAARGKPLPGTVFGKTLRDSRLALALVGALVALFVVAGGVAMTTTYGTPETRAELARLSTMMPDVLRGLYGNPVKVDTLGGFISWHYGAYLALLIGLWSIIALSSTLAGEARRGSLDLTLAAAMSRRRVALEKTFGHVAGLAIVAAVMALAAWLTGSLAAQFPGDEIALTDAVGFAVGVALKGLIAGALAFALAGVIGRGAAAGVAGAWMVGGYVVQGYRDVVPTLDAVAPLSCFSWSADHLPLAGQYDWPSIGLVGIAAGGLLVLGVAVFVRRDVGTTTVAPGRAGWLALPVGVRGPLARSCGELLPAALAWGFGLGLYGLVMAGSANAFADLLASAPDLAAALRRLIPEIDLTSIAGFLQYAFTELGFLLLGLTAVNLVAVHHGDESSGRLELQLSTPLSRLRWMVSGTVALWLSICAVTALFGATVGLGIAAGGTDPVTPMAGMAALGLYAAALAGIGVAAGGLFGPRLAAPVVFTLALGDFLVDVLAPMLGAPDWVAQLALTNHLGKPMVGDWDWPGVALCLAIAIGGLSIGVWGMRRRDLAG